MVVLQITLQRDPSTSIAPTPATNAGAASRCAPTCRSTSTYISPTPASSVPPASVTSPAKASYASTDSVRQVRRFTAATCVNMRPWSKTQSAATSSACTPKWQEGTETVAAILVQPVLKASDRAGCSRLT